MSFNVVSLSQIEIPSACDPDRVARKTFSAEGVTLIVPDIREDIRLRWLIERGYDLVSAYKPVGLYDIYSMMDILPEPGLRDCCFEVLKWKYLDPGGGRPRISGGNMTCVGFWNCFVSYIETLRETGVRGRIKIAEGVIAPAPNEAQCIKDKFAMTGNLAAAYYDCNCANILPPIDLNWLARLIRENPKAHLYELIKTVWRLMGETTPEPHAPIVPEDHHHVADQDKASNTLIYIGAGIVAALIIPRL